MISLEIFENSAQNHTIIAVLLLFLFCGIIFYNNQKKSALTNASACLMLVGIVDYISSYFGSWIDNLSLTFSVNVLMAISLSVKFLIFLLCVIAATNLATNRIFEKKYIIALSVLGIIFVIFYTIIAPDGVIINILHNALPAIGFAYLATAFLIRCFRAHKLGAVCGCLILVFITYVVVTNISEISSYPLKRWYMAVIGYSGLSLTFLLTLLDEKKDEIDDAQRKMDKNNQRFAEIVQASPFPIVIFKLSDDSILLANDNFKRLFALQDNDLKLRHFRDFFVDADNRRLLNAHLEKEKIIKDFEIQVHSATNETPFWLSTSANIIDYEYDIAIYAAFQDITDRKKREDLWQNQAIRDPLTSLYNRRYFEEEVGHRLFTPRHEPFGIFMIDADHFKNVNDTYGHKTGDKVLIALAATAEKALRENDIVARYGGEEFVVYLDKTSAEDAMLVADRLRESIANTEVVADSGEQIHFTVSIGVVTSEFSQDLNELVKMSDDALYKAKANGRNQCVLYTPELATTSSVNLQEKEQNNKHPSVAAENNLEVSLLDNQTQESQQ